MHDIPVVMVAFGTSTQARDTYVFFEERFRKRYPENQIFWAFSSRILREKLKNDAVRMDSLEEVLHDLETRGYRKAVIQSLHVIPGFEFEKIVHASGTTALKTTIGMPLLAGAADCEKTADALTDKIPDQHEWATVVVGHGTSHPAGLAYRELERILKKRYPAHVFVSVVEGEPSWDDACAAIKRSSIKRVKFIPLMFVAGDHIVHDVLGDTADDGELSWKMQLAGYELDGSEQGLGFNKKIVDIYLQHVNDALRKISSC
jgi:sirohydrochlorin cobaltochelatase